MKARFFTVVLSIIVLFNSNAQCPPTGYPMPTESCQTANSVCDDLDGYCGTLSTSNNIEPFPGCMGSTLDNDQWLSFVAGSSDISILIIPSICKSVTLL